VDHYLHGSYAASRHGGYGSYVKKTNCNSSRRVARFVKKKKSFCVFWKVIHVRQHFYETKEMTSKESERLGFT
jgi:hypothetical protein